MKKVLKYVRVVVLAATLVLGDGVLEAAVDPVPASADGCQFVLGFLALHNLISTIVGNCLVNEYHNSLNGDGLQDTSGGLLVWRKADNWTAFTDGYRTWINAGPCGVVQRLNNQRFGWEANPDGLPMVTGCNPGVAPVPATPVPTPTIVYTPQQIQQAVAQAFSVPHVNLPPIQAGSCAGGSGSTTVIVTNQTQSTATLFVSGPTTQFATIAAGGTATLQLPTGDYKVAAKGPDPSAQPSTGVWNLGNNCTYQEQVVAPPTPTPSPTATPIAATGVITIVNDTGGDLSVSVTGPVQTAWTVANGATVSHALPPGAYQLTVQANCGSETDSVSVSANTPAMTFQCKTVPG